MVHRDCVGRFGRVQKEDEGVVGTKALILVVLCGTVMKAGGCNLH